jgi:hypothetical protein
MAESTKKCQPAGVVQTTSTAVTQGTLSLLQATEDQSFDAAT